MEEPISEQGMKPDQLLAEYLLRKGVQNINWAVEPSLEKSAEVVLRNGFASTLARRAVEDIFLSYVYLSSQEMIELIRLSTQYILPAPLRGFGIELGAGCGLLSALIARIPQVDAILSVEICRDMVSLVIPKVARELLNGNSSKVIPVVGSFDNLKLVSNSVDFAVEMDSFHHSRNLRTTLTECARVLKPQGIALLFDRSHPNELSDEKINQMLSAVYSREFLLAHGYPADIKLTRRENGEHEYRLSEWQDAFAFSRLELVKCASFFKPLSFKASVKGLLSVLPHALRRCIYQSDGPNLATSRRWVRQTINSLAGYDCRCVEFTAPKETTVFVLKKP